MDNSYLKTYFDKIKGDENKFFLKFRRALKRGKSSVYHNVVSEAITLDSGWVDTMESALFSVEKIVRNPKKFIIDEDLLVDVERAKKTTAKTVRHLSSNSQFVQSISEAGEVRPKKLLTTEMNEDLAIYENRFICTLVHFCVNFVENRYNDIKGRSNAFDQTGVGLISNFKVGKSDCEVKLDIKVKEEPKDKILLERNNDLIARIEQLRKRLRVLISTDFIRKLSDKKPVRPPIMKTNIIKMNVDYQNCYKLWLYVSSYTYVGFSVQFQDKNLPVETDFYDDLTTVCALGFQALFSNNYLNREEYEQIPFSLIKEKQFKVLTAYKFQPEFNADKKGYEENAVNEYYFQKLRDEIVAATKRSGVEQERDLKLSFARFCRSIAKINGEMYADVINSHIPKESIKLKTPLQKKEEAVKKQKLYLQRYRQLSLLKREELEKTLKAEARELIKLEKLEAELAKEKGRVKSRKERQKKEKERLKRIKDKKALAVKNAQKYEDDLREKDAEKLAQKEEERRLKREAAQRRRDLKRLEELKEKYDET